MSVDPPSDFEMEIAYVLFIDVVRFTRLLINEQGDVLNSLNGVIRKTAPFQSAEAAGKLVRLPAGDGMALAFFTQPEAPVRCALEISEALKNHPSLQVRMGIHSGPVSAVTDVNDRSVVAGTGINMAQRVMDCGDAGHILLSRRIADDLAQYARWTPHLHHLGVVEVKHGVKIDLVNLYTAVAGNPAIPEKIKQAGTSIAVGGEGGGQRTSARNRKRVLTLSAVLLLSVLAISLFLVLNHTSPKSTAAPAAPLVPVEKTNKKSIAVLPFENLSGDPDNAFFTDGVQDEIRTNLAKVAELKVISRTSVMQYKTTTARNLQDIAQALKVGHILEGSVQRVSNRVRVAVQLIDARADAQLWAEHYDRPLDDVFAIQSEIAKAIVEQLRARISPSEKAAIEKPPTNNLAAYDLYNRAKTLIATSAFGVRFRGDLSQAANLLDDAVVRDPLFLAAYCELAGVHDYIYFYGIDPTPARLALAEAAVTSALKLGPETGEAHLAKAQHLYCGYFDYDGARAEITIARRTLRDDDPRVLELTGYIDRRQGRQKEGLENLERASELDPRNFEILQEIALSYGAFHRYPEMAAVLDRALAIVPADVAMDTRVARAQVNLDWQADTRPLHAVIEEVFAKNADAVEGVADNWLYLALCERDAVSASRALAALGNSTFGPDAILFSPKFGEGLVARMQGKAAAAQAAFMAARAQQEEAIRSQGEYGPALCVLGMIDAALGRKEDALREGRRAIELLPLERDALNGLRVRTFLAIIYAWTGEKDQACQQLASTLQIPASVSYGELRLHPYWDPLRGDPCFETIVAGLVPKKDGN
jgi:TolB-like protein/Tfp pilus assembly protein PilF